jgi:hypothetical protein
MACAFFCVAQRYSNPLLMLVLDAEVGALVVSVGARDDDAALLGCLEHVSYANVFFFLLWHSCSTCLIL